MKHEPIPTPPSPDEPPANGPRWTPRKMAEFLRALAATHSVSAAAKTVGMSRQSAYDLRSRLKGKAFDVGWDQAFHRSYSNLPYAALDRAINGTEVKHYFRGKLIGTSRRYDERLTVALLKLAGNSNVLVVGGPNAMTAEQGKRFEALLAGIEAHGEQAEAPPAAAEPDFRAGFSDLSPGSDAQIMAELRRSRRKGRN
jgi:hypothetical protein